MEQVKDIFTKSSQNIIKNLDTSQYFYITLTIIIFILIILISWIFDRLSLKDRSCKKLDKFYYTLDNKSYFNNNKSLKESSKFDDSTGINILKNYYIKSSYNSCCGDGYKNNFVDLCALEKCIAIGCRFLDFEIYSYNNEPIVASSTANNNYIKETYNALELENVLTTITEYAFDATKTNCANDPLILNFRIMSTNLSMLEKIGDLFETILDVNGGSNDNVFKLLKEYNYATQPDAILNIEMKDLYKKIIIICHFNPNHGIVNSLTKLKNYINILGDKECIIYRYNDIISKGTSNRSLMDETKRKFVIVLPNLDNSSKNYDSTIAYSNGCQAIAMKHQFLDNNLLGYNDNFKNKGDYSFTLKTQNLINVPVSRLNSEAGITITTPDEASTQDSITGLLTEPNEG